MADDFIKKSDIFEKCRQYVAESGNLDRTSTVLIPKGDIEKLPAADVREVVLCADCKHKGWIQEPEHGKSVDYCRLLDRCVDKQFFCAAGERNCGAMMDGEG